MDTGGRWDNCKEAVVSPCKKCSPKMLQKCKKCSPKTVQELPQSTKPGGALSLNDSNSSSKAAFQDP